MRRSAQQLHCHCFVPAIAWPLRTDLVPAQGEGYPARMAHTSTLDDNGTTQVPQAVHDALRMQPGDELEWHVLRDGSILCRYKPSDSQRATLALVASKLAGQ